MTKQMRMLTPVASLALLVCIACDEDTDRELTDAVADASTDAHADSGSLANPMYSFPCAPVPTVTGAPTFTAIYLEVLCKSGCADFYCHGNSGAWGGLDLTLLDGSYLNLVNQPTGKQVPIDGRANCSESPFLRVKPGAPEESLLYLKVAQRAPCGTTMPPPSRSGPISASQVEQIRRWIELGAQSYANDPPPSYNP